MIAENGYLVQRYDAFSEGGAGPDGVYVARSIPELMRVIKQIATEARLLGNQPSC
jgi:hypothetical protein